MAAVDPPRGRVAGCLAGMLVACVVAGAAAGAGAGASGGMDRLPGATGGDPLRGRAIALGRDGNCLLCHPLSDAGRPVGNLAPPLDGAGARLDAARLRERLVDPSIANPNTIMPSYFRVEGLRQVGAPWQGRPILDAQQIEDVVAWLQTLK